MSANLRKEEEIYLREIGFDETWLQRQIANDPTLLRITPDEQAMFLRENRKCALATINQSGFPHLVTTNFVFRDGAFYVLLDGNAQTVIHIHRNPKVAIMVETGDVDAEKALMARGECEIIKDPEVVEKACAWFGVAPTTQCSNGAERNILKQVILKIQPHRIVTWDYSKLCGQKRFHA